MSQYTHVNTNVIQTDFGIYCTKSISLRSIAIKESQHIMSGSSPRFRIGNGYDTDDLEEDWFWDM